MVKPDSGRPPVVLVSRSFVTRTEDKKFLLVQRAKNDSHNPGLWECPGGKLEAGQDIAHAQEEEVMQEAGILVHAVDRLAYYDSYISSQGKYIGILYVVLFGIARAPEGSIVTLSDEHDDYAWVTFEESLKYSLTPETRKAILALRSRLV